MNADLPVTYNPSFMSKDEADKAFNDLLTGCAWVHRDTAPRQEYYVNAFNVSYTYGAVARTYEAQPEIEAIRNIRLKLEESTGTKFEVCFLNYYKDQTQHLGWHSDNSPEMDDNRPIAIISLGVEREIWFRPMEKSDRKEVLLLNHGSLALMHAGMQDTWQHRIPKCSRVCGGRISLTFRGYVSNP